MEKFKISDIREAFADDLQRFRDETRGHLGLLIAQSPESQQSLSEAIRFVHSLKGLAATVEAWGLANWGADLEKLIELAGTFLGSAPDKAEEIFRFIMQHMESWKVMNELTLAEQFEPAWEYYQGLRRLMDARWSGYLGVPVTALPPSLESAPPPPAQAPLPAFLDLAPPPLRRLSGKADSSSGEAAQVPLPAFLNLAPPPLRRRSGKADSASGEAGQARPGFLPPRPVPLSLPTPPLLRASAATTSPTTAAAADPFSGARVSPPAAPPNSTDALDDPGAAFRNQASAAEDSRAPLNRYGAAATPPSATAPGEGKRTPVARKTGAKIPRVSPPTLRRKKPPLPTSDGADPPGARPEDVVVVSAASGLPPNVNPPTDDFSPGTDSEMLEMLGQEISGYLGELTGTLKSLAARLQDQELWETTRRLYHTIKGTAATFHLDKVSAPAKAAEARCIVAVEDAQARTAETFEACLERAGLIAAALQVSFAREEVALALAEARSRSATSTATTATATATAQDAAETPLDAEMAGFFIRDVRDQIEVIEQAVLRWEEGENPVEQLRATQRGFHTLKGAANSIGLARLARSVHEAEGFLELVAAGGAKGSPGLFAFLIGAVDQLRGYLKDISVNLAAPWRYDWAEALRILGPVPDTDTTAIANAPAPAVSQPVKPASDANDEESHTLRIDAARLHKLMNLIGEVVIDRARLEKKLEWLTRLYRVLNERNATLTSTVQSFQQQFEFNLLQGRPEARGARRAEDGPPASGLETRASSLSESEFSEFEFDRYDQFSILARSLIEISRDVEEVSEEMSECLDSFGVENTRFRETSRHLQDNVSSLSLLPVSTLFPPLQRAFRDAVQVEHKDVDLELEGGAALLDKVVIDKIFPPLMHLLRNAVAHGIEDAPTRERLKKPVRGRVRLGTTQLSNQLVIQIRDDGSGVRTEAVRQRAIEKGWLQADAPPLTPEQVVHFIFQPGFSTASKLTSVSGRGVGLDVVRKEIEGLNGSVELQFEPDVGSTWTLRVPLTLSISEAILADSGGITFAFPINFVESGLIIEMASVQQEKGGRSTCAFGGDRLPVANLSELLALPGESSSSNGLIISAGDRRAIIAVDRVLRRQEIVVKQLDSLMARHPLLNGATLDVGGQVIPILNLPALLKFSEGAASRRDRQDRRIEAVEDNRQLRVLIVDDSLSVRKVQERLLADLGCQVTAASDGLNALEKLREGKYDFIFTDLEMPRINGYELICEVRGNPAWAALPVVVISSRGADKYITKAMNLGATSFLSKPFTSGQLEQVLNFYGGWNSKTRVRTTPASALQEAV